MAKWNMLYRSIHLLASDMPSKKKMDRNCHHVNGYSSSRGQLRFQPLLGQVVLVLDVERLSGTQNGKKHHFSAPQTYTSHCEEWEIIVTLLNSITFFTKSKVDPYAIRVLMLHPLDSMHSKYVLGTFNIQCSFDIMSTSVISGDVALFGINPLGSNSC